MLIWSCRCAYFLFVEHWPITVMTLLFADLLVAIVHFAVHLSLPMEWHLVDDLDTVQVCKG